MSAQALLQALVQHTVLFSAAIVLVAVLRLACLRWLGASAAYLSWLALPLMLVASVLPQGGVSPLPAAPQAFIAELRAKTTIATTAPAALPQQASQPGLAEALLLTWALGAGIGALLLVVRQQRFSRRLQRDGAKAGQLVLPAGSSPGLIGLWPARLGLPADFEQRFSAEERALILAHEAVHARRHDNAWNLLASTLWLLQWFNPLAWWALRRMRADQELSCDAAVLNAGAAVTPEHYASLLLKSHGDAALPALSSMWRPEHPLVERVRWLARHPGQARAGRLLALGLSVAAAGLVYAGQMPAAGEPAPAAAAAKPRASSQGFVRLNHETEITHPGADGSPKRWHTTGKSFFQMGTTHSMRLNNELATDEEPQIYDIAMTVNDLGDRGLQIETRLRTGDPAKPMATPRIIIADGSTGAIESETVSGRRVKLVIKAKRVPPGSNANTPI